MKQVKIQKLILENFKKFKHLELVFDGDSMHLYGKNEIGKTTIIDSFHWCLFGKNANGDSKFSVKPILSGEEQHHLTTRVEIEMLVDGVSKRFAKELVEVWTKKRGSAENVFSGHTCNYFINDVAKTEKQYKDVIEEIVSEKDFKLLSNVYAFTSLKWDEQRSTLFDLINVDTNDLDLIARIPELKELEQKLKATSLTVEELNATSKRERKLANEILERTPIEIATLESRKFNLPEGEFTEKDIEEAIKEYQDKIANIVNSPNKNEELERLLQNEQDLILKTQQAENEIKAMEMEAEAKVIRELKQLNVEKDTKMFGLSSQTKKVENLKKTIEDKTAKIEELYKKYDETETLVFDEKNEYCQFCGQKLPSEKIEEIKANFNNKKAEDLKKIVEDGKALRSEVEASQKALEEETEALGKLNQEIVDIKNKILDLEQTETIDLGKLGEVKKEKLVSEIEANKAYLEEVRNLIDFEKSKASDNSNNKELEELNNKLSNAQRILTEYKLKQKDLEEIEVKKDLITKNTAIYEEAYLIETQIEQFEKMKAKMLEGEINSAFEYVSFKLFEEQINGGIKPTCVVTVKGIPYPDVNNAGKIHAGLDIIRKLQEKLDIQVPILMDNCECLSSWEIGMNGTQMIRFFVSPDEDLKFEKVSE